MVLAYVYRGEAPGWLASHFRFQIRTFWIGLLYMAICIALMPVVIGVVLLPLVLLWLIVRCAKGMNRLSAGDPHPDPTSWMFG